jgi:hypothetical protein
MLTFHECFRQITRSLVKSQLIQGMLQTMPSRCYSHAKFSPNLKELHHVQLGQGIFRLQIGYFFFCFSHDCQKTSRSCIASIVLSHSFTVVVLFSASVFFLRSTASHRYSLISAKVTPAFYRSPCSELPAMSPLCDALLIMPLGVKDLPLFYGNYTGFVFSSHFLVEVLSSWWQ